MVTIWTLRVKKYSKSDSSLNLGVFEIGVPFTGEVGSGSDDKTCKGKF